MARNIITNITHCLNNYLFKQWVFIVDKISQEDRICLIYDSGRDYNESKLKGGTYHVKVFRMY